MSPQTFSDIERRSIWEAHGKRCAYCNEPLQFRDLFIDHVIPQTLKNSPETLSQLETDCGFDSDFDLHSDLNLVPSCHRCNTAKGAKLFEPPRLILILEIAKSKAGTVQKLKERFQHEDAADKARVALSLAVAKGSVTIDEASQWLSEITREDGSYRLNHDLKLADGTILETVSKQDVDRLLDAPIEVNQGQMNGLELNHGDGSKITVRTCREYQRALKQNYYPYTTYALKVSSDFEIPLAVLTCVANGQVPERSFIQTPHLGVSDLNLMPTELAPGVSWGPADDGSDPFDGAVSLHDLVQDERVFIRKVGTSFVLLEDEGSGCMMMELMRADITGNGNEDILIFKYDYATQGTFGAGSTGILSRACEESIFSWEDTTVRLLSRL